MALSLLNFIGGLFDYEFKPIKAAADSIFKSLFTINYYQLFIEGFKLMLRNVLLSTAAVSAFCFSSNQKA